MFIKQGIPLFSLPQIPAHTYPHSPFSLCSLQFPWGESEPCYVRWLRSCLKMRQSSFTYIYLYSFHEYITPEIFASFFSLLPRYFLIKWYRNPEKWKIKILEENWTVWILELFELFPAWEGKYESLICIHRFLSCPQTTRKVSAVSLEQSRACPYSEQSEGRSHFSTVLSSHLCAQLRDRGNGSHLSLPFTYFQIQVLLKHRVSSLAYAPKITWLHPKSPFLVIFLSVPC